MVSYVRLGQWLIGAEAEDMYFFRFIYLFWETARGEEGQRGRKRENPKQAPCCQHRAQYEAQTRKTVRSWPRPKPRVTRFTDRAIQAPPAPYLYFKFRSSDVWVRGRWRLFGETGKPNVGLVCTPKESLYYGIPWYVNSQHEIYIVLKYSKHRMTFLISQLIPGKNVLGFSLRIWRTDV